MASEVFITRRGSKKQYTHGRVITRIFISALDPANLIESLQYGEDRTAYNATENPNWDQVFVMPENILANRLKVWCIGGGGGAYGIYNAASSTHYGFAGGGSGWMNSEVFTNILPGQVIPISIDPKQTGETGRHSCNYCFSFCSTLDRYGKYSIHKIFRLNTGGGVSTSEGGIGNWTNKSARSGQTVSFGTYLSAAGGTAGRVILTQSETGLSSGDYQNYISNQGSSTIGSWGGNGGSGGGAIYWDMSKAYGGKGYQFGGGGGGYGGDGGVWGGGGAGTVKGGKGGTYGGGGGSLTTGGSGGTYGGAAGVKGTAKPADTYETTFGMISITTGACPSPHRATGAIDTTSVYTSTYGGNKHFGGGGYGTNYVKTGSIIQSNVLFGGGGYGSNMRLNDVNDRNNIVFGGAGYYTYSPYPGSFCYSSNINVGATGGLGCFSEQEIPSSSCCLSLPAIRKDSFFTGSIADTSDNFIEYNGTYIAGGGGGHMIPWMAILEHHYYGGGTGGHITCLNINTASLNTRSRINTTSASNTIAISDGMPGRVIVQYYELYK